MKDINGIIIEVARSLMPREQEQSTSYAQWRYCVSVKVELPLRQAILAGITGLKGVKWKN